MPGMTLWIAFALLTVAAALAVLVPLARGRRGHAPAAAHDAEVYRAQLDEIERDLDRGLVSEEAATAARTEIARRLLAASREAEASGEADAATGGSETAAPTASLPGSPARRGASGLLQVAMVIAIPAAALFTYLTLGSPDLADQPLSARLEDVQQNRAMPALVAKVEQHLADNPDDGRGWDVLAPVYMRLGRTEDAVVAYRNAIRLLGSDERRETDLGEALVILSEGIVTAEARAAFDRAVALDPKAVKPRFFLALALGQENRKDEAITAWKVLLAEAKGGEAWVEAVRMEMAKLGAEVPPSPALPGPDREAVAAAAEMSASDRAEMIKGMVDQLDTRLSAEGGTAEEWMRLMRALAVMGDGPRLREVKDRALVALKDDPAAQAKLRGLAEELGIGS